MAAKIKQGLSVKMYPKKGGGFTGFAGFLVVWIIGQSNGIGRAAIRAGVDDDYSTVAGRVFQYGYTTQTVTAATNPLDHVNENAGQMGFWLEFCKTLLPTLAPDKKILLVPCCQGGTSFSANNWNPGNSLNTAAKARLAAAMNYGPAMNTLHSVIFWQGESDADAGATAAGLHQGKAQIMYDDFVSTASGMTSVTPFLVGTIKPDKPNAPTINAGLFALAEANPAITAVDFRDLSWFDSDHYTAAALATAGQRFASVLS